MGHRIHVGEGTVDRDRCGLAPIHATTPRAFAVAHSACLPRPPERMWTDAACPRRRCCVNRSWHRALPRVGSSPIDRERLWSTKLGHSIEHVARKHRFDSLRCASPTSKSIAENRLVSEERVLDAGLSMIADLLLPSTAPNLADPSDRPIASARPRVASGRMCCNFQKEAGERWVGSSRRRFMQPPRTAC